MKKIFLPLWSFLKKKNTAIQTIWELYLKGLDKGISYKTFYLMFLFSTSLYSATEENLVSTKPPHFLVSFRNSSNDLEFQMKSTDLTSYRVVDLSHLTPGPFAYFTFQVDRLSHQLRLSEIRMNETLPPDSAASIRQEIFDSLAQKHPGFSLLVDGAILSSPSL